MQHDRAIGGPAHASIRNTHHVSHTFAKKLRRESHIADLGHSRIATRSAILEDHNAIFINIERLVVDTRVVILDGFKNYGTSAMLQQVRAGSGQLDYSAIRGKIATQNCNSGIRLERT